jgi:hypothetical protein
MSRHSEPPWPLRGSHPLQAAPCTKPLVSRFDRDQIDSSKCEQLTLARARNVRCQSTLIQRNSGFVPARAANPHVWLFGSLFLGAVWGGVFQHLSDGELKTNGIFDRL